MNANERPTADKPVSGITQYSMTTFSNQIRDLAKTIGEDYWRTTFEQSSDGSVKFGAYISDLSWIISPTPDGVFNELQRLIHKENMDVQLELPEQDSELPITNSELPSNPDQIDLPF